MSLERLPSLAFGAGTVAIAGSVAYAIFLHSPSSSATPENLPVIRAMHPGEDSPASQLLGSERTMRISPAKPGPRHRDGDCSGR